MTRKQHNPLFGRIGSLVRVVRAERGQSMEAAANEIDMSPVTWLRVERGLGIYGPTMRKVARYLDVPSDAVEKAVTSDDAMTALEAHVEATLHTVIEAVPRTILWRLVQVSVAVGRMRVLSAGGTL